MVSVMSYSSCGRQISICDGKLYALIVLVCLIARVRRQISILIVDELAVREQIGPAENDLPGQKPAAVAFADHIHLIVRLLDLMVFGVRHYFKITSHERRFHFAGRFHGESAHRKYAADAGFPSATHCGFQYRCGRPQNDSWVESTA